jgi:hypothetical protein
MKKAVLTLALLAVCSLSWGMDRKTGNPRSVYLEKGSVSLSLSGGYNHVDAGSLTGGSNYSLMGLINNLSGKADVYDASFSGAWFFANNFSLVGRIGYSGLDIDLDSSSVMSTLELNNKHITRPMLTVGVGVRGYLPLFNSKIVALFGEVRLSGGFGSTKSYSVTERGKEGTFSDVNEIALGFYPGISVFLSDHVALEISLPLLEGGYSWDKEYEGQIPAARAAHAFGNFKPNLLKLNLGIVFNF